MIAIIVLLYLGGTFDKALYPLGLNAGQCGENAFGAVFCGKQLTEYNQNIQQTQQSARQSLAAIQRQARQAECSADPQIAGC